MSERYSRVFVLPEIMYSAESPIIIENAGLLKDNKTGKILAQLKMVNIADKKIKAATVKLACYDTAHNHIDEPVVFEFLDLDANRDESFGAKTPIPIPNALVREFEAKIVNVVFEDRSSKSLETASWKPLPKQKELKEVLGATLSEQYMRDVSVSAQYEPITFDGFWKCSCGALNHAEEHCCHSCKQEKTIQFMALNCDTLAEHHATFEKAEAEKKKAEAEKKKEEEAAAEEARRKAAIKAEEEARAKKKKMIRIGIVIAAIAAAVFAVLLVSSSLSFKKEQHAIVGQTFTGSYYSLSKKKTLSLEIIDEECCVVKTQYYSSEEVPYTLTKGLFGAKLSWDEYYLGPREPFDVIVEGTNIKLRTDNYVNGKPLTLD